MTSTTPNLTWIANYIWGIADDVLRDVYVRGKYRDVILPMTVLRRLDAVLEPTKQAVLDMDATLDKMGVTDKKIPLRQAADNIVGGPEHSTLSNDAFPTRGFDFMLSNPPGSDEDKFYIVVELVEVLKRETPFDRR